MFRLKRRVAELESTVEELRRELAAVRKPRSYRPTPGVKTGRGARIHPTCELVASGGRDIVVGERTLIRRNAEMVGPITIGAGCSFNRDAYVRANVTIGNNVNIGAFARIISDSHQLSTAERRAGVVTFPGIVIGNGVFIGASVTILGGVTIGDGAVVAAGSLVNKDVPANTVVGGVPARPLRTLVD